MTTAADQSAARAKPVRAESASKDELTREQVALVARVVRAFFRSSRRAAADVEDCVGDVLEGLVRRPVGVVDHRGAVPVLVKRTRWAVYDWLRREQRQRQRGEAVERELGPDTLSAADDGPDEGALAKEIQRVMRAVRTLSPVDVDLIVSTFAYGETIESAASRHALSVSGAWRRRERAMQCVRARSALGGHRGSGASFKTSGGSRG